MRKFHIVTVGNAKKLFADIMSHVRDECNYKISYIISTEKERRNLIDSAIPSHDIYCLQHTTVTQPTSKEIDRLNSMVQGSIPTVHNMIMSDRIVSKLTYQDGIAYGVSLSKIFEKYYLLLKPSVVIGCHDGMHSGMGAAVAKFISIPWFCLNFTTIPKGYAALSRGIIPEEMIQLRQDDGVIMHELAERTLHSFKSGNMRTPAYISPYNIRTALKRSLMNAADATNILKEKMANETNKYTQYKSSFIARQFMRKKKNILFFPKKLFLNNPITQPYVFFGLHMQPESSIDVYAPFYSNQFDTIEKIARSIPPTHKLLVKLHISDADNYSRSQLNYLSRIPGVALVSPTASSKEFIENCSIVITIAGTMGLEAALMGKPVIIFGKMDYEVMPSVTRVNDITDLPALIKQKLNQEKINETLIIKAYEEYLKPYFPAIYNDWNKKDLSTEEKNGFVTLFRSLEKYLNNNSLESTLN